MKSSYEGVTVTVRALSVVVSVIDHVFFFRPVPISLDEGLDFWVLPVINAGEVEGLGAGAFSPFLHDFFSWE